MSKVSLEQDLKSQMHDHINYYNVSTAIFKSIKRLSVILAAFHDNVAM